jgi:hypothetical protein
MRSLWLKQFHTRNYLLISDASLSRNNFNRTPLSNNFTGIIVIHFSGNNPDSMMNATNLSPHIYHDYSTEHITRLVSPPGQENSVDCFPLHLHMILSNPANRDIICWMSHGRSWKVNDMEMLRVIWEEQVGNLFCGFNRSVRAWGFKVCTFGILELCTMACANPSNQSLVISLDSQ